MERQCACSNRPSTVAEVIAKARNNTKALHTLDGYKRGLANTLTRNLQRFGFERVSKTESLQEIIDDMRDDTNSNDAV
jgi:hypothetical protein